MEALKHSQMGQHQKGKAIAIGTCSDRDPVAALHQYLAMRGPIAGYLFQHKNREALMKHQLWTELIGCQI